jgi:hypothetical protein
MKDKDEERITHSSADALTQLGVDFPKFHQWVLLTGRGPVHQMHMASFGDALVEYVEAALDYHLKHRRDP